MILLLLRRLLLPLALAADGRDGGGWMQKAVPRLSGSNPFMPYCAGICVCSPRHGQAQPISITQHTMDGKVSIRVPAGVAYTLPHTHLLGDPEPGRDA